MSSRSYRFWAPLLLLLLLFVAACGGGGDDDTTTPGIGPAFSLTLQADPTTGPAPLTVTFQAVATNGRLPYSYAWDFNGDNVIDSNAPTATYTFMDSSVVDLTVTDGAGESVSLTRSITVTEDGGGGGATQPLDVRFTVEPQSGNVPFNAQFQAFVNGGKPPYTYSWDFDGDGVYDTFGISNPLYTYEEIGAEVGDTGTQYLYTPILKVEDSRGVVATNLDDPDGDGQTYKVQINALPPQGGINVTVTANPAAGQAPLQVEFTAAVVGGSGDYLFEWDFGDGQSSDQLETSIANHTYVAPGEYLATVTVTDENTSEVNESVAVVVDVRAQQQFSLAIDSDITAGQVPFVVNFEALPVNGTQPITYYWDVFTDITPDEELPSLADEPSLAGPAVVTPDHSNRKNPTIHFGNVAGTDANFSYAVRCVAIDANGNEAEASELIRIVASPNTTYPFYECLRPMITEYLNFPISEGTGESSNAEIFPMMIPVPWGARANPAVCTHPAGISYVLGGETVDELGNFEGLVQQGDSAYAFVPAAGGLGTHAEGSGAVGKYNSEASGHMIRLNDGFGPTFPGSPRQPMGSPQYPADDGDTRVPPQVEPEEPPAMPPPTRTQRSSNFVIVGSAAAVMTHEPPETNPAGAYPGPGEWVDTWPESLDRDIVGYPPALLWAWPECPMGWQLDNPMAPTGKGTPVIYVFGGRTEAFTPTDLIQKYYPWGYGSEDLIPWSQDFSFQTTGNQVDIWSPYFLRPDQDQFPGNGDNFEPQIDSRQSGAALPETQLPRLPEPLYGHMVTKVEAGIDRNAPDFPYGYFQNIYIFGGIKSSGQVSNEARIWNPAVGGDADPGDNGFFSLLGNMPNARAYGRAVFLPDGPFGIALVGGVDNSGAPLEVIDVLSFDDQFNPTTGGWETFEGTLPEALEACGAGYNPSGGQDHAWVLAYGGWDGEIYSHDMYTARLETEGNLVVRETPVVAPRSFAGSSQSGSNPLTAVRAAQMGPAGLVDFNRYYSFGGVDENGLESIAETLSLP